MIVYFFAHTWFRNWQGNQANMPAEVSKTVPY